MSSFNSILQFWKDQQNGSSKPYGSYKQNENKPNGTNQQNKEQIKAQSGIQEMNYGIPREYMMSKKMIQLRIKLYLIENKEINVQRWNPPNKEIHKIFNRDLDKSIEYPIFNVCVRQIKNEWKYEKGYTTYNNCLSIYNEINTLNIFEKFILLNIDN